MKRKLQNTIMWAALGGFFVLAVFSVFGAFVGAERAAGLFNSPVLVGFWVAFVLLFGAGLIFFRRLLRRPGLLGMHAGVLLILVGAMYGSDKGHAFAAKVFGSRKIPSGYVAIHEGSSSNRILDPQLAKEIAQLPFSLKLNDFSLEYYDVPESTWDFIVEVPVTAPGQEGQWQHAKIEWTLGQDVALPYTDARVTVLEYLDSARPVFAGDARPHLEITQNGGKVTTLDAEPGREVTLSEGNAKVRITRVFSHLFVQGSGEDRQVVDLPDSSGNPALGVEIEQPDGTSTTRYVMVKFGMHGEDDSGIDVAYKLPEPSGAESDPTTGLPAAHVKVTYEGREVDAWLIAREGDRYARLPLEPLLGASEGTGADAHSGHSHAAAPVSPDLYLVKPTAPVRDYKSDIAVVDEGVEVAGKVVEVNHPLHYGGYHFYQYSYDNEQEKYTILSVTSDSGLGLAYAGFILLCFGAFYGCWVQPAMDWAKRRKSNGG